MNRLSRPARIAFSEIMIIANASAIEPPRLMPCSAGDELVLDVVLGGLLEIPLAARDIGEEAVGDVDQLELAQNGDHGERDAPSTASTAAAGISPRLAVARRAEQVEQRGARAAGARAPAAHRRR